MHNGQGQLSCSQMGFRVVVGCSGTLVFGSVEWADRDRGRVLGNLNCGQVLVLLLLLNRDSEW